MRRRTLLRRRSLCMINGQASDGLGGKSVNEHRGAFDASIRLESLRSSHTSVAGNGASASRGLKHSAVIHLLLTPKTGAVNRE